MRIKAPLLLLASCFVLSTYTGHAAAQQADNVIVSQGGVSITLDDVDAYLQRVPEKERPGFMDSPKRIESLLLNLLRTRQLANQSRDMKLDQRDIVKRQLALADDEVLAKERVGTYVGSLKMPDFTVLAKEQYAAHKSVYATRPNVEVQHILISTKKHSDGEAAALAELVRKQAIADPASFDGLVERYSEDASKANNKGHMLDAASTSYAEEFAAAAAELKEKDAISAPVHTRFGYHILKLISVVPGKQKSFEDAKGEIVADLRQKYVDSQRNRLFSELGNQKMDSNAELVASLRTRYLPEGAVTPQQAAQKMAEEEAAKSGANKPGQ